MNYVRIKDNYRFREEPKDAIIFDYGVENILKKIHRIPKSDFGLLILANGQFTNMDLIEIYSKALSLSFVHSKKMVDDILKRYGEYIELLDYKSVRNDLIVQREFIPNGSHHYFKSFHRLSSPLLLSLVLTYQCICSCKYCYVGARKDKDEFYLKTEKIFDIIDEAKRIGISSINITGGDPFLRDDIFEILEKCINEEITINISTKKILTADEVERLKEIKLNNIQVSIDALDNDVSGYLTGVENYADKMLETINLLILEQIDVSVNTVVTKLNIKEVPFLITRLNNMGVKQHSLSPYLKTLGRHDNELFPKFEEYENLNKFINGYTGKMKLNYKSPNYDSIQNKSLQDMHRCTGGRMGMVVTPSGKVTICERLIDSDECFVGDVNYQSLQEIWDSDKLLKFIYPDKDKFENTDCYDCKNFNECILDKGLCYARSKVVYNTIYNKDPLCPNENEYIRFV